MAITTQHRCRKCHLPIVWVELDGRRFALDASPTALYAFVGESGKATATQVAGYGHAPHRCGGLLPQREDGHAATG